MCLSFLDWRESHFFSSMLRTTSTDEEERDPSKPNTYILSNMSDKGELDFTFQEVGDVWRKFYKDALFFAQKCKKPDRREFMAMFQATMIGFSVMGFTGCLVRLLSIPLKKVLIPS